MSNTSKKIPVIAIVVFYIIAIAIRYITTQTSLLSFIHNDTIQMLLRGSGPAIGALVVVKLFHQQFSMTLKGNFRQLIIPFCIYWLLPIILLWIYEFYFNHHAPANATFFVLLYGLLEEIGWRGFLQQALKPLPKIAGIFLLTVLWYVWHLHFELTTSNLIFFVILLLGSWGIGLVKDKTNSLLAVAAFHSLNNFYPATTTKQLPVLAVLLIIWIISIRLTKKYGILSSEK